MEKNISMSSTYEHRREKMIGSPQFLGCVTTFLQSFFEMKIWLLELASLSLHATNRKTTTDMATYTITLNERTASGKALMAYLQALGVLIKKVTPAKKNSFERSQEDILEGRVEKFASSEEMFQSLGI